MAKLKIHKREFPFEVTPELRKLAQATYIKLDQIGKAKNESKRFAYLACREACKAAKIDFAFTFEEFINLAEPDVIKKAGKLAAEMKPKRRKKTPSGKKPNANKSEGAGGDQVSGKGGDVKPPGSDDQGSDKSANVKSPDDPSGSDAGSTPPEESDQDSSSDDDKGDK